MMALKRSLFTLFLIKGNNSSSQEYSNTAFRSKSNSSCYRKKHESDISFIDYTQYMYKNISKYRIKIEFYIYLYLYIQVYYYVNI